MPFWGCQEVQVFILNIVVSVTYGSLLDERPSDKTNRNMGKMDATGQGEGNFPVSMNTSLHAPFQVERLGLGLYVMLCSDHALLLKRSKRRKKAEGKQ